MKAASCFCFSEADEIGEDAECRKSDARDDIGDEDGDMCDNENNDGEPNMRRVSKKPTKYAHLRLPLRTTTTTPCRT